MEKQKCDSYLESAIFCGHSICPELHVTCYMDDAIFIFVGHVAKESLLKRELLLFHDLPDYVDM